VQKKRNLKAAFGRLFYVCPFMSPSSSLRLLSLALVAATALLAACASPPGAGTDTGTGTGTGTGTDATVSIADSPWAVQSPAPAGSPAARWTHQVFPGKTPTSFQYVRIDGRDAVAVRADSSASMLRQPLRLEPDQLGHVRFSWKVPALMNDADLAQRDKADAAVRVVLVFDGDRSRFPARDAALSELTRAVMGEELPYATLMYVWSSRRPEGTVLTSTRTSRIRKLVVESGPQRLGQWLDYERDVRADYLRVFGEEPGPLIGVGIMTDSDNTRSKARAWYGPVRFLPPPDRLSLKETPVSARRLLC
jgi:predicted small secreted protein